MGMTNTERIMAEKDGNILRNMLREKVLPENVLEEYFRIKVLLDRVSAGFTPFGLAMVLLNCKVKDVKGVDTVDKTPPEQPEPEIKYVPKEEYDTKKVDGAPEQEPESVDSTVVPKDDVETAETVEPELPSDVDVSVEAQEEVPEWPKEAFAKDTKISIFHNYQITDAVVVNAYFTDPKDLETLTYQVEIEGEDDPVAVLAEDTGLIEETVT